MSKKPRKSTKTPAILKRGVINITTSNPSDPNINETIQLSYKMHFLDASFFDQLMALQSVIIENLTNPDLLQPFEHAFMADHIERKGRIIGVLTRGQLIGFRAIYFPNATDRECNLGFDIGLNQIDRQKLANLQLVCVHPRYRGNQLAQKMNNQAIKYLREETNIQHLLATVHPLNFWNLKTLLNSGFVIRNLKYKYSGKLRYIVYQNLKKNYVTRPKMPTDRLVDLSEIDNQKQLLNNGYVGISLVSLSCSKQILFVKDELTD